MIVLQTNQGEHLGFCLVHPSIDMPHGDCIFSIVPQNSALFESNEAKFLLGLREKGEHQWRWMGEKALTIQFQGRDVLQLREDGTMGPSQMVLGKWSIFRKNPRPPQPD